MERRVQQRSAPNLIDGNLLAQLGCDQITRPFERNGRVRSLAGRRVQAKAYDGARAPTGRPGLRSSQGGSRGPQQRRRPCTEAHVCPKETTCTEEKTQETTPAVEPPQQVVKEAPLDPMLLTCVDSFVADLIGDAVAEDDDTALHEFYADSDNEAERQEEEEEPDVGLEAIAEASETASGVQAANPQEPSPVLSHAEANLAVDECTIPAAAIDWADYEEIYSLESGDEMEEDLENDAFMYLQMAYSYARNAVSAGLAREAELGAKEDADDLEAKLQEEAQTQEAVVEQQKYVVEAPTVEEKAAEAPVVEEEKATEAGSAEPEWPKAAFRTRPSVGTWFRRKPRRAPPALELEEAAPPAAVELQEAAAPEVEAFLQEEQQQREREEADASDLVEEFLMEQASEQKAAPAPEPAPEQKAPKLNLNSVASVQYFEAVEIEPMSSKRTADPAKHSRRRTIIGGVVREATGKQRPVTAPAAHSETQKMPAWALPMSPTASPTSGSLRRQQSYCQGSATGTARMLVASQKDLSASVFRMDSDTEEPTGSAAKRQSSLAASYDALGVELHSLESGRPTSPQSSLLSRMPSSRARPSPKGDKRSSALSRAATSMVLDGESSKRSSVPNATVDQSPPSSRSGRRSRVVLRAAPSAMEMDLADGPARALTAAPSREQLASVSSLAPPLFKSKRSTGLLPSISAPKLGAADWSVGVGAAGKRWVGGGAGAAF